MFVEAQRQRLGSPATFSTQSYRGRQQQIAGEKRCVWEVARF